METFERGQVHPTAIVGPGATLGREVTVGPFAVIHDGAEIGDGSFVGPHCVIGEPTADFYGDEPADPQPCIVGAGSIIRSHSVLYQGVTTGSDLRTGHRVTIQAGSILGDGVQVGTMGDLQGQLTIGNYVRLQAHVAIGKLSVVEDFVWMFPNVGLTNDPHPPSETCIQGPIVRRFAVIATYSLLLPGVEIGENALVGAMSLVTRDVPAETVVVGVPAKPVGSVRDVKCKHGALESVYPWTQHFRRGYPEGVLPPDPSPEPS